MKDATIIMDTLDGLETTLDKSIKMVPKEDSEDQLMVYDLTHFQTLGKDVDEKLKDIYEGNNEKIKSHPVTLALVTLRWEYLKKITVCGCPIDIFGMLIMMQVFFVGSLTCLLMAETELIHNKDPHLQNSGYLTFALTFLFLCLQIIKEARQMYDATFISKYGFKYYILSDKNLMQIIIILATVVYMVGILINYFSNWNTQSEWTRISGSLAIMLAWLDLFFYFGRLSSVGHYIQMFSIVAKKTIFVISIYMPLFIAFGLGFYGLLATSSENNPFENPYASILRIFAWVSTGEIAFEENFMGNTTAADKRRMRPIIIFAQMGL